MLLEFDGLDAVWDCGVSLPWLGEVGSCPDEDLPAVFASVPKALHKADLDFSSIGTPAETEIEVEPQFKTLLNALIQHFIYRSKLHATHPHALVWPRRNKPTLS